MSLLLFVLMLAPPAGPTRMEPQPSRPAAPVSPDQIKRFNEALHGILLKALPEPLYEKRTGEGRTSPTVNGLTWDGLKPRLQYADKNDGSRRHLKLTADRPKETLQVSLKNVQLHEEGRTTFDLHLGLPARLAATEERWKNGVKLFDGTVKARVQTWFVLHCESKMRIEAKGFLPTIVYRLRVKDTDFTYTDLVFEHVPGLGGEAARIVGDFVVDGMKQWKPSIERKLRDKLEASIVKAADTKEIRIGLDGLSKGKKAEAKNAP